MDRNLFIKLLSAGAGSFLVSGIDAKAENIRYDLKKIKIYDNYARGVDFRKWDYFTSQLVDGDALTLIREPENKYDRFAIKIFKGNFFIGYIAAYENIVMAMLMDQGVKLEANAGRVKPTPDVEAYLDQVFSIEVYAKLMVPYDHINISDITNRRADDVKDKYRSNDFGNSSIY